MLSVFLIYSTHNYERQLCDVHPQMCIRCYKPKKNNRPCILRWSLTSLFSKAIVKQPLNWSANACPNTCLLADLIPPITLFSQTGFSGLRCFFSASHLILPFIRCEPLITELPQRPMNGSTSATPRYFWGEIYGTFCLKWDRLVLGKLMLQCLILRRNKITHCSKFYTSVHLCFSGRIFNLPHFINPICKT